MLRVFATRCHPVARPTSHIRRVHDDSSGNAEIVVNVDNEECQKLVSVDESSESLWRDKRNNFGWTTMIKLPNGWTLAGHSEGREASGFVLVEPRIFLDAGMQCRKWSPHAVLVTHAHQDHSGQLPALLTGTHDTIVCMPQRVLEGIYAHVASGRMQKRVEPRRDDWLRPFCGQWPPPTPNHNTDKVVSKPCCFQDGLAIWAPMRAGDTMSLHRATVVQELCHMAATQHPFSSKPPPPDDGVSNQPNADKNCEKVSIRAVACVHTTDDVGYVIYEQRQRLRHEYRASAGQGKVLAALSKSGVSIVETVDVPQLAYICDTTIDVFLDATTASLILASPVVMIECNFLGDDMEDEAHERGHMCWTQLEPIVMNNPQTMFVLFHFSQRYRTNAEVREFFAGRAHRPRNVRLWLTGEVVSLV